MDDPLAPPMPAHLSRLAAHREAAQRLLPWVLESVERVLRSALLSPPSDVALIIPSGLPVPVGMELLSAMHSFVVWVRSPQGPPKHQAEMLSRCATRMLLGLLAAVHAAPFLASELELVLLCVGEPRPLPQQPLAGWWTELLGQAQAALGAEA